MKNLALGLATLTLAGGIAAAPAHAVELTDQIDICEAHIAEMAELAGLDLVSIKFRSNGNSTRLKKLSFQISTDDSWGAVRCAIRNEEIRDVRWPQQFRSQLQQAEATKLQLASESNAANAATE